MNSCNRNPNREADVGRIIDMADYPGPADDKGAWVIDPKIESWALQTSDDILFDASD